MTLLREFCAENTEKIPAAIRGGANRIELCARLDVGGLTPSAAVMSEAVAFCNSHGAVPVMVLIRPHANGFVYSQADTARMCTDIAQARQAGATGVVLGALTQDGTIDRVVMRQLLDAAQGLHVTFHMAFDAIRPFSAQLETELPWLRAEAEAGRLHRLLTHGSSFEVGCRSVPIEANVAYLRRLVQAAAPALHVLPGGGITTDNAEAVAEAVGVREVHGTRVVRTDDVAPPQQTAIGD